MPPRGERCRGLFPLDRQAPLECCRGAVGYLFPALPRNPKERLRLRAIQLAVSSRDLVRWKRIGNGIIDGRQGLQIREYRLQILICHVAIPIPGHRRKNRSEEHTSEL